jgi:hypothetical protein
MNTDLFELVGLQGLFAYTTGCDIKMIPIMVADADVAVATGNPVSLVGIQHYFTNCF